MIRQHSSFIVLYTDDLQKTAEFYLKFGVTIKEQDERKCVFHLGDFDLHFNKNEDIPEYAYVAENKHGTGIILYVEIDDLENAYTIAKCIGGKIKSEIAVRPWGTREFLFQDPNGYNIVFFEEI